MAVSPAQVQQFLTGMDYPCDKQDILNYAMDSGADRAVMDVLHKMPGDSFHDPSEVSRALGQVE